MAYTIAFFGTKPYDEASFNDKNKEFGFEFRYYKGHLNKNNVLLTQGVDAVCIFVNDTADAEVINAMAANGVKLLALRCAGFNNVDLNAAANAGITVVRVPAYSPYAVAKLYGYWIVKEYREAYDMFCCSGILFNHESERRGETFVTRKITLAAARIAQGKQDKLYLGNLSSLRDWGYAKDYVECMWLILQNDKPEDFVIATGEQHSVREFCYLAFKYVGIELEFVGEGENEKGVDKATGKVLVEVSPDFYRPTDVVNLWGDPTKAKTKLGWNPAKTPFGELVRIMVEADVAKVAVERAGEQVKTNLAEYLEKGIVK